MLRRIHAITELQKQIDTVYLQKWEAFKIVEKKLSDGLSIPEDIIAQTIKRYILRELNLGKDQLWLSSKTNTLSSLINHISLMCLLFFSACFGCNKKKTHVDIIFDAWGTNCSDFYEAFTRKNVLTAQRVGVIGSFSKELRHIKPIQTQNDCSLKFSRVIAQKLLKFYWNQWWQFRLLSTSCDSDINRLLLKLCIEIARCSSEVKALSADVLLSGNDNGYSPLRYWLYRCGGIKSIILIQNGGRVGMNLHYNSYTHCDVFFGWSAHRVAHFLSMQCPEIIIIGSPRLSKFLQSHKPNHPSNPIDILFIEQIYDHRWKEHKIVLKFLRHIVRYAKERPDLTVRYSGRFEPDPDRKSVKDIQSILKESLIKRVNNRGVEGSYKYILDTDVIISYDSSLRLEALAMDKTICSCNYDGRTNSSTGVWDYVLEICDPMFAVETDKYEVFKSKLDFLMLKSNAKVINKRKEKMSKRFGWDANINAEKAVKERVFKMLGLS